jgi:hypothetical protein
MEAQRARLAAPPGGSAWRGSPGPEPKRRAEPQRPASRGSGRVGTADGYFEGMRSLLAPLASCRAVM